VADLADHWATVAVIVPGATVAAVLAALRERLGTAVGDVTVDGLSRPITVIAAEGAKGLEFDAVVVGEPEAIIAERADRPTGLRLLYVALTRPTQHLSIVSSTPLPAALVA
jgi:DNA helicase IV